VKREAQQKHISLAVQERQKLRDILDRRKEEVRDAHKVLQKQIGYVSIKRGHRSCQDDFSGTT
jgi:Cdc6-like AAA superfamily ATPase